MFKINKFLTIAFLLTSLITFGQTYTNIHNLETQPYIEVIGTAEKEESPDEIYLRIVIRERYVNKVKLTIEEQESKLISALKSLNIDLKNLDLTDANADYIKIRWKKKDVITKKEYTLMVSDATTVGKVFQKLDKIEISDAFVLKVNHSKIDSLRKEVKILAIKAAKNKADYLLTAIGEQIGKPLIIKENEITSMNSLSNVVVRGARSAGVGYYIDGESKSEENNEIEFQKIKIQSSVYIKYSIK